MTARERLNARPAPIHPSRRRAPARNPEVRSNSDNDRNNMFPNMHNKPAFHSAAGVRAAVTVTHRPGSSLTSHLAPIEIP
jgi:hypothetical protein